MCIGTRISYVWVTAFVKEALTDVQLRGTAEITVYYTPYKVSITDNTTRVFKLGLPFSIFVNLMFPEKRHVIIIAIFNSVLIFFNDHIFRLQFLSRYSSIVNNLNIKYLTKYIYI